MIRLVTILAVLALCAGQGGRALGSVPTSSVPDLSISKVSSFRDSLLTFLTAADSILVYELADLGIRNHRAWVEAIADIDSTKRASLIASPLTVPDTVTLVGSFLCDGRAAVGSVGFVAKSRGRKLDEIDRAYLMALLAEPGAYQAPPDYKCVIEPAIGVRIYRGVEVGEILMETTCLRWYVRAGHASGEGHFRAVVDKYRRFATLAFRDNPTFLRSLEGMH